MTPQQHQSLDHLADAFNPVLTCVLLAAVIVAARRDRAFEAWKFLARVALALLATYLVAHANRWLHWWPSHLNFPSGHVAYAAAVLTSLSLLDRRWMLLIPALAAYSTLIVMLGYHSWPDIIAAALFAPPLTWACHRGRKHNRLKIY